MANRKIDLRSKIKESDHKKNKMKDTTFYKSRTGTIHKQPDLYFKV